MQDAELMERVKAGDESAFKMIVDRHHRAIYHLCYRYLEKREDAEEVAQDVFIRLYRSDSADEEPEEVDLHLLSFKRRVHLYSKKNQTIFLNPI